MPRRSPRPGSASAATAASTAAAPKRRVSARLSAGGDSKKRRLNAAYGDSDSARKSKAKRSSAKQNSSTLNKRGQSLKSREEAKGSDETQDATARPKGKELWREGVRTGLGPGKEVFIQKPKARDPGDTLYEDETLHPNTMLFLQDLKQNNDREWLKAHDADYRAAKKDWETFVESLTEKIIEKDETIPELPAKDVVFRIHRDVRFSKNPTPYKTHFSAAWSRTGKKGPYAAYYVHLEPEASFVGCGLWMPEAEKLALLREEVDQRSHRLKAILREANMRRVIFDGIPDEEREAVKAFVDQNKESSLKIKPKGYEVDNENILLLRLRSFTISKSLADVDLLGPTVQEKIATLIGTMEPFVTYLNKVVMPDPGAQDSTDESEDEDGASV
ncbi:hypothetical protein ASPZODRAFT_1218075 [Penicilliopsis zonata CBS 506.65]|uniref:TIGR02453 family protein n=1 Tax=Penicilliopsis zonata CBS 506.65 TaxID=1073090 RepID=A0A1L9S7H3_9EURO|nr:hypothetical protein ASPZODRAFT_1218075 [Penicilliopsis zonata CBS 506.65]OJJ43108.1 hypothetical protein ASPZODRAFT_1218075 [Penicilliopsis zonata CBS 506.65]